MTTEKISNGGILSGTINASSNLAMEIGSSNNLVGGNINSFPKEIDPTIPDYIKEISKEDIAGWDNNAVVNEEQNKTLIDLESYLDTITPKSSEKGQLVHITNALLLPTFENVIDGASEQNTIILPNEYQQVEYIESNGNQYIDTGVKANGNTQVKIGVKTNNIPGSNAFFYGARQSAGSLGFGCGIQPNWICSYGINNKFDISGVEPNTYYEIEQNNELKINGNTLYSYNRETFETPFNICIFALTQAEGTTFYSSYKLYYMKIYDNELLIRNFVPCYRKNDNIIGLYDLVNDVFYTNERTSPFTYGSVINIPNPYYPQEIEVLEAYNLCPTNVSDWEVGSINQSIGDNMKVTNRIRTKNYYPIQVDTDYYISLEDDTYRFVNIILYNNNKEYQVSYYSINSAINGASKFVINIPSKSYPNISFMRVTVKRNDEQNLQPSEIEIIKPMMTKGTDLKPYLPYGCVGYKVNRKNLLSVDMFRNKIVPSVSNGQDITNGAENMSSTSFMEIDNTLPLYLTLEGTFQQKYVFLYDKDYNFIRYFSGLNNNYVSEIYRASDYKNTKYIKIRIDGNVSTITKAQLEYNEVATEIEPYQEQITYLDLKGNWVGKIKDSEIEDELYTDKKNIWLNKNVNKRIFTGEENWVANTSVGTIELLINDKYVRYGFDGLMCSHFHIRTGTDTSNYVGIDNNSTHIRIWGTNMTLDEFKAFVKEEYDKGTPITLVYQTKETETKHLGELPEPIKTFEGINNIQLLANIPTEIEVKYALDVKKYADDRYIELTNALVSTGANL